jgi:hypothetical protein
LGLTFGTARRREIKHRRAYLLLFLRDDPAYAMELLPWDWWFETELDIHHPSFFAIELAGPCGHRGLGM